MEQLDKLVLICVETNKKSKTDVFYINKALKFLYKKEPRTKIDYVYMDGKHKYNNKNTIASIEEKSSQFFEKHIVYCIDTDDIFVDSKHINLNDEIEQYCNKNNYELVWFCRNIEEVFLHRIVIDKNKVLEAKRFGAISEISPSVINSLKANIKSKTKSNFKCIFDKYLEIKKDENEEN